MWTLRLTTPPPRFEKSSHFDLFAECFPYGVNKDAFGFNQIWVGFCHLWGQQRYIFFLLSIGWVLSLIGGRRIHLGFVIYGWVLSHMGSAKIYLGFVKYGLGFVTYGEHPPYVTNPAHKWQTHLWRLRNGYIHIHIYISITEASKMGLSFMGGVCHIWGQRRYIWVLSNMGWVLSLMGSIPILTNPTHWWQTPILLSK